MGKKEGSAMLAFYRLWQEETSHPLPPEVTTPDLHDPHDARYPRQFPLFAGIKTASPHGQKPRKLHGIRQWVAVVT